MKTSRPSTLVPRLSLLAWLVATALLVAGFQAVGWERIVDIGSRIDSVWVVLALSGNLAIQPFAAIQ